MNEFETWWSEQTEVTFPRRWPDLVDDRNPDGALLLPQNNPRKID